MENSALTSYSRSVTAPAIADPGTSAVTFASMTILPSSLGVNTVLMNSSSFSVNFSLMSEVFLSMSILAPGILVLMASIAASHDFHCPDGSLM
jgi:hypothetical protein